MNRVPANLLSQAHEAANAIHQRWGDRPRAGIVLGTGLSQLAEQVEAEVAIGYDELPHFFRSTALSHRGRLLAGRLDGTPVVVLDGRWHLYEGYSQQQVTLPVLTLNALGIELLILSNASGGLNPRFASGDLMLIEDHINFLPLGSARQPAMRSGRTANASSTDGTATRWRTANPYCPRRIESALQVARRRNFTAHRGVYVAMSGPNYETRAEYRFLRRIGGDAVGMSTVPEAQAAASCGLPVLAISIITNVAHPDAATRVRAEDVVFAAERSEPHLRDIVTQALADLNAASEAIRKKP